MAIITTSAKLKPILLFSVVCMLLVSGIQADVSLRKCKNPGKAITITTASMDPDPVVSGSEVTFTFEARAATNIAAGNFATIQTVLQYNGDSTLVDVTVPKSLIQKRDTSDFCQDDGVNCPIFAGTEFSFAVTLELPKLVLMGDMSLQVRVISGRRTILSCVTADFKVDPNAETLNTVEN